MEDHDYENDGLPTCPECNGSGEGRVDGSHCYGCKGSGVVRQPVERDEPDDWPHYDPRDEVGMWAGVEP